MVTLAMPTRAKSESLIDQAWAKTLLNEPGLRAAQQARIASRERSRQALAGYLPQVTASVNTNNNNRAYAQELSNGPNTTNDRFNSNGWQLNLTQPLLRSVNVAARDQALALERQAEFQLFSVEQELLANFIGAWFDVMAARDAYEAARETVASARQQMVILEKSLALGISSEVQYDEVRGKRGQAEADQFQAESELRVRVAKLEQLTGPLKDFTPPLATNEEDARAIVRLARTLEEWLVSAKEKAPSILAARAGLDNAKEEVAKQQAQHMPTLDLVASINYNAQAATGNFPGQSGYRSKQQAVGLQLNVPLYAGGSQNAKVREAVALQSKAEADLDAVFRTVEVNVKQAWAGLQAASGRHPALSMTVKAAKSAIRAAVEGQTRGLKTPADELQLRQQFQASERDRRRALYDVYVNTARLLASTGELNESFLGVISGDL